jgi:hypothetical protein
MRSNTSRFLLQLLERFPEAKPRVHGEPDLPDADWPLPDEEAQAAADQAAIAMATMGDGDNQDGEGDGDGTGGGGGDGDGDGDGDEEEQSSLLLDSLPNCHTIGKWVWTMAQVEARRRQWRLER